MGEHKHVISALERKYAELLGERSVVERQIEDAVGLKAIEEATARIDKRTAEIDECLEHLKHVARLFSPEWSPHRVKPKKRREEFVFPGQGTVIRAVIAILREECRAMSAWELQQEVAKRQKTAPLTGKKAELVANNISGAMRRHEEKGTVIVHEGEPLRWSLKPPSES